MSLLQKKRPVQNWFIFPRLVQVPPVWYLCGRTFSHQDLIGSLSYTTFTLIGQMRLDVVVQQWLRNVRPTLKLFGKVRYQKLGLATDCLTQISRALFTALRVAKNRYAGVNYEEIQTSLSRVTVSFHFQSSANLGAKDFATSAQPEKQKQKLKSTYERFYITWRNMARSTACKSQGQYESLMRHIGNIWFQRVKFLILVLRPT